MLPKLIAILGPTASGKTDVALHLAWRFAGEIVLADSRQLYRGMDVGTNKSPGTWRDLDGRRTYFVKNIPYHGVDLVEPDETYTVQRWKSQALETIRDIQQRQHLPLLEGGSVLYSTVLLDNLTIPEVPPTSELRRQIEQRIEQEGVERIAEEVLAADPAAEAFLDRKNPRRVVRAMEIILKSGKLLSQQRGRGEQLFDDLRIGLKRPLNEIDQRIEERAASWMESGTLEKETLALAKRYGWDCPSMQTVGYSAWHEYTKGSIDQNEVLKRIVQGHKKIARSQLKWYRRDPKIRWVSSLDEAEHLAADFLK